MRDKISVRFHPKRLLCLLLVLCLSACLPAKAEETDLVQMQERLLALGYEIGEADGILGTNTSTALLLAQTLLADAGYDVSPTGKADAKTAELIMQAENTKLLRTLLEGSWGSRVKEAQIKLINLVDALFCEVNPIPVKHAMNIMGMNAGPMRRPLSPMEPENIEKLKAAMRAFGLIQ